MKEVQFKIFEAEEGGYYARALGVPIFTQGETLEELELMIKDAVDCHYDNEAEKPKFIFLHSKI